jgi:poly(3-hydroxybutyrate) depolymerase
MLHIVERGGVCRGLVVAACVAVCGLVPAPAQAAVSVPVLSSPEVPAGGGTYQALKASRDPARHVDGRTSDWHGRATRFGGSSVLSSGELVYQDHIFDAYGPDNGQDVAKLAVFDPLTKGYPETYRLDPALQYLPGEFGIPTGPVSAATHYGDDPLETQADLSEVRVGSDSARNMWLLARTTTMGTNRSTALLVLLDTAPGSALHTVPFNSGLHSTRAEVALLLTGTHGWYADLRTGKVSALPAGSVATDSRGYANAVEARIPRRLGAVTLPAQLGVAVASGLPDGTQARLKSLPIAPNVANVAFRTHEPSRDWWDRSQALTLAGGTVDPFFARADLGSLARGANQRYLPGPGYHDRLFHSTPRISKEADLEGTLQHYGVYLPKAYRPSKQSPLQFWFHFRGGTAHIAAALVPRIYKDMGEDANTVVVSPRGRGTSRWYVGKGHVDWQEVWADVHRSFNVDRRRTYIAGHSMGGWASYLLPILYPDRFAASFPASAPPTQGAYTGADFATCDNYTIPGADVKPCYTAANGSDPRAELTTPLLPNLRDVPLAIYHGAADELVPVSGVARQVQALNDLGYRYRFYLFPHQEHYGPPIQDQWAEGVRYEHSFVLDPNPAHVTYIRSRKFENAIEHVQSDGVRFDFDFAQAYWMSGLDLVNERDLGGIARFDGRSLAIPERPHTLAPEAGVPQTDQTGPYVMKGQKWQYNGAAPGPRVNGFVVKISGAKGVRLDVARMRLSTRKRFTGDVDTGSRLRLVLRGHWPRRVSARVGGKRIHAIRRSRYLVLVLPRGHDKLVINAR